MVTTRSEAFRDRLTAFRSHGMVAAPQGQDDDSWLRQQLVLGFNYRITDLQCALGTSQLRKLEEFVARRNELAARYREAFADVEQLELAPAARDGMRHAYHLFVIRHRGGAEARRRLYHRLRSATSSSKFTTCRCTCIPGTPRSTATRPGYVPKRSDTTTDVSHCRVFRAFGRAAGACDRGSAARGGSV